MRLHRLEVCAFGPFASTETVDFDALSSDGLFLLRGPTGSGKTSVLDALTFALYGDVPGERSNDRLKSQHAPAARIPYVELEFSSGEDRYWLRRQPTYYRPAKRAGASPQREGTVLSIKRFDQGSWKPVPTARVAEGDAELQQIIGLKMHEFTKVILLPQGAFAKLLYASNEERRAILEQLFDTGTYERLESLLWEQMRQAESELKDVDSQIQAHASGVRSAAAALLGTQAEELEHVETQDLSAAVNQRARTQQSALADAEATAKKRMTQAAEHAEELSRAHRQLQRWAEHVQRRDQLEATRSVAENARRRIAEHTAAAGIRDWMSTADQAEQAHAQAQRHAQQAVDEAQQALDNQRDIAAAALTTESVTDTAALESAVTELVQLQARLSDEDAAEAEDRHMQLVAETRAAEHSEAEAESRRRQLGEKLATQKQQLQDLRAKLLDPEEQQNRRDALHQNTETASGRTDLIDQRDRLQARLRQLKDHTEHRRRSFEAAREAHREAAEANLRSQAHQLAEGLEAGQPCLVCGSTEHPAPLVAADETGTDSQLDAAAQTMHTAQADLEKGRADHRSAEEALETVRQSLGDHRETTAEEARSLHQSAADQLAQADSSGAAQRTLREDIERIRSSEAETRQEHTAAAHHAQQGAADAARLSAEAKKLQSRIEQLRAEHASLTERHSALSELKTVLSGAQRAARKAEESAAQARRSAQAAQQQLEKSDFASADEVAAAVCAEEELAPLRQRVAEFEEAEAQLRFDAELEEVRAGARRSENEEQPPGQDAVAQAQAAADEAKQNHQESHRQLTAYSARFESLREAADALDQALARRAERTQELMRRAELARTINGQGENTLRMRLTTFVLAARLERIAEAATHHLSAMTSGRYQLLLDAERAGRGLRGLDLQVHDEYAGQLRPAESLSGGETFMTSLAMALGLAEVVQSEAGGIGMESLFIDEGFGSLDDHTLEAVMSALHTLQGEGRRIGVVSHVSEMHQQIPVQLRVEKTRTGSTLHTELPT